MDTKIKGIGIGTLRTIVLMALTAVISALSRALFVTNLFEEEYFSEQVLNAWHMVFFLLIFNSLAFTIRKHDKSSRARFLEHAKSNKLKSNVKFTVSSIDIYVEIACIAALSVVLPVSFLYGFVSKAFFYGKELTAFNNKLYTLLIILPIMLVLLFATRIMAQKSWYLTAQKEKINAAKANKSKIPPAVKSVVFVAIVYCGGSMAIAWLMPMLVTLWNLGGAMLFVWLALAVAALILAVVMIYYIRAIIKRMSFVKKLKKYCADNSVYLSDIKKPCLSLLVSQDGSDFTIEKNGTKYDCKFIAGIFPNSPVVLSDKGKGLKQDTVRIFRVELFHFMTRFDFGYEGDGKKILVLLPTPKKFFVSADGSSPRLADVGEKAGEYTVYNAFGFLNALQRGIL